MQIWDVRRPYIPFGTFIEHTDDVTGKGDRWHDKNARFIPKPSPNIPSLAVWLSGRGPGTFSHVSDVMDRANYPNVGVM